MSIEPTPNLRIMVNQEIPQIVKDLEQNGIVLHKGQNVLYKYVSVEIAKKILTEGHIRFSTPGVFNDTQDMCVDLLDTEMTEEEVKWFIEKSIDGRIDEKEKPRVREWALKSDWNSIFQSSVKIERDSSLIFCSSQKNSIEKLWTFYAEQGAGVCIGLRLPMYYDKMGMITAHVNYANEMTPFKYVISDDNKKFLSIMNWVFTKSSKYSDEEEVRTYIPPYLNHFTLEDGKYWHLGLQPFMICEIYYGNKILPIHIAEIDYILKHGKWEIEKKGQMYYPRLSYDLAVNYL